MWLPRIICLDDMKYGVNFVCSDMVLFHVSPFSSIAKLSKAFTEQNEDNAKGKKFIGFYQSTAINTKWITLFWMAHRTKTKEEKNRLRLFYRSINTVSLFRWFIFGVAIGAREWDEPQCVWLGDTQHIKMQCVRINLTISL